MLLNYQEFIDDKALEFGLKECPEIIESNKYLDIIKQIIALYKLIKKEQKDISKIYFPDGEWQVYINERFDLYDSLLNNNIEEVYNIFKNFWRNKLGPIVSQYAYFSDLTNGSEEKKERFKKLMSRDYTIWQALYLNEKLENLSVPRIGNPWGYSINNYLIIPQAFRFHNHCKQISNILIDYQKSVWAELGGGYGGTCYYYFKNNPNTNVTYINFDLPETLVIAAYYLLRTLPERKILLYYSKTPITRKFIEQYDIILMPNYAIEELENNSVDLFLNAFSLSEMPYNVISNYISHIERVTSGYFLHNNMDRKGIVNRGFERIPCSDYPINSKKFKLLYKKFDLFQGYEGDYREYLYQKI
jgi:putative sugar O-methyltransferase